MICYQIWRTHELGWKVWRFPHLACWTCQLPTCVCQLSVFFTVLDARSISVLVLSHLVQKKWSHQPKLVWPKTPLKATIWHGQKTCFKLTQPKVGGYQHLFQPNLTKLIVFRKGTHIHL